MGRSVLIHRPCDNCPFLKSMSYLRPARARELAENALSWDGQAFWCHKTLDQFTVATNTKSDAMHCAGSAILSEKHGIVTQSLRIAGRLGLYNPDQLRGHDLVYESLEEMVDGHLADRDTGRGQEAAGGSAAEDAPERAADSDP
jgi:hypothetical protein